MVAILAAWSSVDRRRSRHARASETASPARAFLRLCAGGGGGHQASWARRLLRRLPGEGPRTSRRRTLAIPRFFTDRACLRLVFSAPWRTRPRWRALTTTERRVGNGLFSIRQSACRFSLARRPVYIASCSPRGHYGDPGLDREKGRHNNGFSRTQSEARRVGWSGP